MRAGVAASTGCDAQPWFRIFNPVTQSQRFDPKGKFIRRYLPELARVSDAHIHYPAAMNPVDLASCGLRLDSGLPAACRGPRAGKRTHAGAVFASAGK
jgi:deoxyribodipyrimidine photo-lyase